MADPGMTTGLVSSGGWKGDEGTTTGLRRASAVRDGSCGAGLG